MTTMISRSARAPSLPNRTTLDATNPRPAKPLATPDVRAPGGPDSPATGEAATPTGFSSRGSSVPGPVAKGVPTPIAEALLDPALCLAADVLDDLERVRIANENRVRQMTRSAVDSDGEERGFGYPVDHPDVVKLAEIVANLTRLEHEATLELQRRLRKHPLGGWVKATKGVGEKQGARLLASIGDPYINGATGQPRTVSALWAYSGLHVLPGGQDGSDARTTFAAGVQLRDTDHVTHGDLVPLVGVAAKRRKGERANWSTKAKMRAYLIAESCLKQLDQGCKTGDRTLESASSKAGLASVEHRTSLDCRSGHTRSDAQDTTAGAAQTPQDQAGQASCDAHPMTADQSCGCSPYRIVYDRRRAHTAVTHPEWTDGHSHNDALRVASKAILRDLWRAAREWHLQQEATS